MAALDLLAPPLAVHRAGEHALLAEYPSTTAVLAAAASVRELAPAHLVELVPAERTLLLVGTAARDLPGLAALLEALPAPAAEEAPGAERTLGIVYDGEDLDEVAALLGMSASALVEAHSATRWTAAFGGFAPGFAYLLPEAPDGAGPGSASSGTASASSPSHAAPPSPVGPPWEVPRRAAPRTSVPAGAVGLAAHYCAIYPRSSPGGWQLIGRSEAALFDPDRTPPALLAPGTRVRFTPQRAAVRLPARASALAQAAREAVPARRGLRRAVAPSVRAAHPVLEVLQPGLLALLEDTGRPGLAASGVSRSGAFDRGAMLRANLAVGNPAGAAVLEAVAGPLHLQALAPTVIALSGAQAPLSVRRAEEDGEDLALTAEEAHERPVALDPGDLLELGAAQQGLRLVLAVRGGLQGVAADGRTGTDGPVLGSLSFDVLSALGPTPLVSGDQLLAAPEAGLDAVPDLMQALPAAPEQASEPAPSSETGAAGDPGTRPEPTTAGAPLEIPLHAGPRDGLLGRDALAQMLAATWTVRPDSDRVGVRLEGPPLPVPSSTGSLASEPMVPGAIQVPPSGLPVVFGPDHPTTGGYPVIAVVTRSGLDALAQAGPGTALRFVRA